MATQIIKTGETLNKIAAANNTTVEKLLVANPQIKDANKISVGATINIPSPYMAPTPTGAPLTVTEVKPTILNMFTPQAISEKLNLPKYTPPVIKPINLTPTKPENAYQNLTDLLQGPSLAVGKFLIEPTWNFLSSTKELATGTPLPKLKVPALTKNIESFVDASSYQQKYVEQIESGVPEKDAYTNVFLQGLNDAIMLVGPIKGGLGTVARATIPERLIKPTIETISKETLFDYFSGRKTAQQIGLKPEIKNLITEKLKAMTSHEKATFLQGFDVLKAKPSTLGKIFGVGEKEANKILADVYNGPVREAASGALPGYKMSYEAGGMNIKGEPVGFGGENKIQVEKLTVENVKNAIEQQGVRPKIGTIIEDNSGNKIKIVSIRDDMTGATNVTDGKMEVAVEAEGGIPRTIEVNQILPSNKVVGEKIPTKAEQVNLAAERAKAGEVFGPRDLQPRIQKPAISKSKEISYEQLENLAKKIQNKETSKVNLEQLKTEIEIADEIIEQMPGKTMIKFQSRGRFEDFKNPELAKTPAQAQRIRERNAKITQEAESAFEGTKYTDRFDNPDAIRESIDEYVTLRDKLKDIKKKSTYVRGELAQIVKGERLMQLAKGNRRVAYRSLGEAFNLTDSELAKIRRGRDIMAMSKNEFDDFIRISEKRAAEVSERSQAKIEFETTIREKELDIEPLRKAMKFPKITNMTTKQLREFDEILQPYEKGDVFLSKRKLETIERTELAGIRTYREAREILAKKLGVTPKELNNIKISEFDRFKGESALAEKDPFFKMMVEETAKLRLIREAELLEMEKTLNKLAGKLKTTFIQKFIPQQKNIRKWFETDDAGKITVDLTPAESNLVGFMQDEWIKARDYLIKVKAMTKGRQSENYFTHVRRGILETVKEDGVVQAIKEVFDQYALDEQGFNILDTQTGEIMALNKFFRYALHRTGEIPPTENIVEAFRVYMRMFKKKQALDEIVPLIDIYAHALTPKGVTKEGLLLHGNLIRFTREWLNTQKGRRITLIAKQGGKIDWALRAGRTFTTLLDIGLNIPVTLATQIGEQAVQFQLLGMGKFILAKARALTPAGRRITEKYRNIIGKNPWSQLIEPMRSIGDRLSEGLFTMFRDANVRRNRNVLLGSLTKEELANETISPERLAQLKISTGRYAVMDGAGSILGATSEAGMITQYKSWALPIVGAQLRNAVYLSKFLFSRGAQESVRGKRALLETFRLLELGSFVAIIGYMVLNEDDDSLIGKLKIRAYQEAMTLFGATPAIFSVPRMATFLVDLSKSLGSILKLEEYKESSFGEYEAGELKGARQLQRLITPRAIKQFEGKPVKTLEDVKAEIKKDIESGTFSISAAKEKFFNEIKKLETAQEKTRFKLSLEDYKKDLAERIKAKELTVAEAKEEFIDYSKENVDSFKSPDEGSFLDKIILHAKAIGTDPVTAFIFLFQGEEIRKIENGTIIVKRIPLEESQQIKSEMGATKELILDHTIPLELGGSNNKDNLKLVSVDEWESYTPVENYLGDKLRAGLVEKEEAQSLIKKLKNKEVTSEEILKGTTLKEIEERGAKEEISTIINEFKKQEEKFDGVDSEAYDYYRDELIKNYGEEAGKKLALAIEDANLSINYA